MIIKDNTILNKTYLFNWSCVNDSVYILGSNLGLLLNCPEHVMLDQRDIIVLQQVLIDLSLGLRCLFLYHFEASLFLYLFTIY